ncbi:MAG: hypothetical protein ACW98Y_01230 [Candidatus Thorarchaeota archaeon]|jgi:hypothetical protein
MRKKHLIIIVMLCTLAFNSICILTLSINRQTESSWIFPDLGPAVVQDSYYGRAPALESPYGPIGDIPGLYSIYHGNPLQGTDGGFVTLSPITEMILLALLFGIVPIIIVLFLGRRSYGSSKTQ